MKVIITKVCPSCQLNFITDKEQECKICKEKKKDLEMDFTKDGDIIVLKPIGEMAVGGSKINNLKVVGSIPPKKAKQLNKKAELTPEQFAIKHPFQGGGFFGK